MKEIVEDTNEIKKVGFFTYYLTNLNNIKESISGKIFEMLKSKIN